MEEVYSTCVMKP